MEKKEKKVAAVTTDRVRKILYGDGVIGQELFYNFVEAFAKLSASEDVVGLVEIKMTFMPNGVAENKGNRYLIRGEVVKAKKLEPYLAAKKMKKVILKEFKNVKAKEYIVAKSGLVFPLVKGVKPLPVMFAPDRRK